MKKSDIALIIMECLIEPHFPEDIEKEANYIVKRLEKAGWHPPAIPDPTNKYIFPVNEWEEENV